MTSCVPFFASQDKQWNRVRRFFNTERFIEVVWKKSFLYDVKDEKHSDRDTVQKAWEGTGKEVGCEGNYSSIIYAVMILLLITN
jgi:hypothetical protein